MLLVVDVFRSLRWFPIRWNLVQQQIFFIGVKSQPVVILTGACIGAVFTAQTQHKFGELGMSSAVGPVVSVAMCRELGPILCGLMIAGRVGAAMATEIATMKITEQIDALRSMAVYPTDYLVVPRLIAMTICMPILVGVSIICGIGAGYLVAVPILGVESVYHINNTLKFTSEVDVSVGLIKALSFGWIIAIISTHRGLTSAQGAQGVGRATTAAVVVSSIILLIANFFITFLLNNLLG